MPEIVGAKTVLIEAGRESSLPTDVRTVGVTVGVTTGVTS